MIVIPSETGDQQLRRERRYYVYIMASRSLNLYTGITDNIFRRMVEHKSAAILGFTQRYHINRLVYLVYYESFRYVNNAIAREKQIKAWTRAKRLAPIKTLNPTWQDLGEGWGEKIELQLPRFTRDDNNVGDDNNKSSIVEQQPALSIQAEVGKDY